MPANSTCEGDERIRTAVCVVAANRTSQEPDTCVYWVQDERGPIKIGRAGNLVDRLRGLQSGNPTPLVCLGYVLAPKRLERMLHRYLAVHRIEGGEWFEPHPDVLDALEVCKEVFGDPSCPECARRELVYSLGKEPGDYTVHKHTCARDFAMGGAA